MEGPQFPLGYAAYPRSYGAGLQGPAPKRVRFEAIAEAWTLVFSDVPSWLAAALMVIGVEVLCQIPTIAYTFSKVFSGAVQNPGVMPIELMWVNMGAAVLSHFATGLIAAGVMNMGLRRAKGLESSVGDIFRLGGAFPQILVAELILAPLVVLPSATQFIPLLMRQDPFSALPLTWTLQVVSWILISVIYTLATFVPLIIVDKRVGAIEAFQMSFRTARRCFWPLVLLLFIAVVIEIAGYLLCLVGALFSVPIYFAIRAIVYSDFFRGEPEVLSDPNMVNPPSFGTL